MNRTVMEKIIRRLRHEEGLACHLSRNVDAHISEHSRGHVGDAALRAESGSVSLGIWVAECPVGVFRQSAGALWAQPTQRRQCGVGEAR